MYFEDMTKYEYFPNDDESILNIGWLDKGKDYQKGIVPDLFVDALSKIPLSNQTRGWHTCQFCCKATGGAEKRVTDNGKTYASPQLIDHYVTVHGYQPPTVFINAVLIQLGNKV